MQICAKLKYTRTAPRKVRLVADLVRGKRAKDAQAILSFTPNKSAGTVLKLLNQAINSAKNNYKIDDSNLYISKIIVDAGPILKRSRPRARGSAYEIQKKTSHVVIILEEIEKREVALPKTAANEGVEDKSKPSQVKESEKEQKEVKKQPKMKIMSEKEILKPQAQKQRHQVFRRQTF